jgi:ferredoxin
MAKTVLTCGAFSATIERHSSADAGRTLLAIAREREIPLLSNCEVGDCAACLVRVEVTAGSRITAMRLTDKEKLVLKILGKLTEAEAAAEAIDGSRPHYRLACQYVVGDEDISVEFPSLFVGV